MKVKLEVNGKEIQLNRFASSIISSTILGLIRPLKGMEDPKNIRIEITIDSFLPKTGRDFYKSL